MYKLHAYSATRSRKMRLALDPMMTAVPPTFAPYPAARKNKILNFFLSLSETLNASTNPETMGTAMAAAVVLTTQQDKNEVVSKTPEKCEIKRMKMSSISKTRQMRQF